MRFDPYDDSRDLELDEIVEDEIYDLIGEMTNDIEDTLKELIYERMFVPLERISSEEYENMKHQIIDGVYTKLVEYIKGEL